MRPGRELGRELWSLVVWWSLWSLWDTYLLEFSPVAEIATLSVAAVLSLALWLYDRRPRRRPTRTAKVPVEEAAELTDVVVE